MSTLIKENGFDYTFDYSACSTCEGRCCTGSSGYIYVTKKEIENISNLLELDVKVFVEKYLYKNKYKYSIKENKIGESYECVFYNKESNGCNIYGARPLQCRTFPFWDYYKKRVDELKLECPGVIDV